MADQMITGPYDVLEIGRNVRAPFYIIRFDEDGVCSSPRTRAHLLSTLASGDYTDVVLVSHGWNNSFKDALANYYEFLTGYMAMRRARSLEYKRAFKPLLVGVYWPSAILVRSDEEGPQIAASGGTEEHSTRSGAKSESFARLEDEVRTLASAVRPGDKERFYELAGKVEGLSYDETLEMARILLPIYRKRSEEVPSSRGAPSAEELARVWAAAGGGNRTAGDTMPGVVPGRLPGRGRGGTGRRGEVRRAETEGGEPQVAGLGGFDPRSILRAATVLIMKDRAGRVGTRGVGALLRDLLAASSAIKVHLIGHSYGCKVLLSAVCAAELPRRVNSVLLLQPAVSYLAFAADTGGGRAGGYHSALDRVEQPILATYSQQDAALRNFFHWVVRREADLGEAQIAGAPPSRFAALGGYGPPDGCGGDCAKYAIKPVGEQYRLTSMPPRIVGLDSTGVITGHGEFSTEKVYWTLFNQFNA